MTSESEAWRDIKYTYLNFIINRFHSYKSTHLLKLLCTPQMCFYYTFTLIHSHAWYWKIWITWCSIPSSGETGDALPCFCHHTVGVPPPVYLMPCFSHYCGFCFVVSVMLLFKMVPKISAKVFSSVCKKSMMYLTEKIHV